MVKLEFSLIAWQTCLWSEQSDSAYSLSYETFTNGTPAQGIVRVLAQTL